MHLNAELSRYLLGRKETKFTITKFHVTLFQFGKSKVTNIFWNIYIKSYKFSKRIKFHTIFSCILQFVSFTNSKNITLN